MVGRSVNLLDRVKADDIEKKIHDWFQCRYPEGPRWTSRGFDGFRDVPLELRMIVAMDKVEAEITNGGLPQLLWNVFYHWRRLLDDCQAGYGLIGAMPQREAIREFRSLFRRYELECRRYIDQCIREKEFDYFNQWCEHGYRIMNSPRERLFYHHAGVRRQRLRWLRKNETRLLGLLSPLSDAEYGPPRSTSMGQRRPSQPPSTGRRRRSTPSAGG